MRDWGAEVGGGLIWRCPRRRVGDCMALQHCLAASEPPQPRSIPRVTNWGEPCGRSSAPLRGIGVGRG